MTEFLTELNYTIGQSISAKVTATNLKGTSADSAVSNTNIVAQDVPQTAVVIDTGSATSTVSSITISWNALTANADTGYSSITSYTVDWENTNGTALSGSESVTSGTSVTVSGLAEGTQYQFEVTPVNIHGNGPTSSSFSMVAAAPPAQMSKVVVSQATDSTQVTFTWSEPDINGLAITSYTIQLWSPVGTDNYTEHTGL